MFGASRVLDGGRPVIPTAFFLLLSAGPALAVAPATAPTTAPSAKLIEGLGSVHHAVSTSDAEAQRFFDQGLALVYGFNHAEAANSFRWAAELDPKLAMAYWGEALALGPNINLPEIDQDAERAAVKAVRRAQELAGGPGVADAERAYVRALAKRYSDDPKADLRKHAADYRDAMRELAKAYPDDLDAATLSAESGMNLRPWKLWTKEGKPEEGTEEIVATLESVLKRNPDHVGANHYYIHAVEASPAPERALPSADRLGRLAPAAGHLVHMPAHVFIRTGRYADAVRVNQAAIGADDKYISCHAPQGVYPLLYYNHNVHFVAAAGCMSGQSKLAVAAADRLAANIAPVAKETPPAEFLASMPLAVRVRFGRWDEVLAAPQPDAGLLVTTATWHFARGMAFAAKGDPAKADAELAAFREASKSAGDRPVGLNAWAGIAPVAEGLLVGRIAMARDDLGAAEAALRKAVAAQDASSYDEPPGWLWPVRETLGRVLLARGDAAGAEQVFRDDLAVNRNNPRSLLGLAESLGKQGKAGEATAAREKFEAAWKDSDVRIKPEDL